MEPLIEFNERGETGRPLDERGRMIDPDPERLREILPAAAKTRGDLKVLSIKTNSK